MSVRCLGEKSGSICAALSGDPSKNDRCLKTFIALRLARVMTSYGFVSPCTSSLARVSLYGRIKNNSISLAGREDLSSAFAMIRDESAPSRKSAPRRST